MYNYNKLKEDITDRLDNLTLRLNLMPGHAEEEYELRLDRLKIAFHYMVKDNYSKLMRNAYEGTVRHYERKQI